MELTKKFCVFLIGIMLSLIACMQDKPSQKKYDNIVGKHIELPDSSLLIVKSRIKKIDSKEIESDIMIVTTLIGTCNRCIKNISLWKDFKNSLLIENLNIIIYIDIDNYDWFIENMEWKIRQTDNMFVLFVDDFKFYKENKIPVNVIYDTFLVVDNSIVLQGSPLENEIMKEKYINEIIKNY